MNVHVVYLAKFVSSYASENKMTVHRAMDLMGISTIRTRDTILSLTRKDGGIATSAGSDCVSDETFFLKVNQE